MNEMKMMRIETTMKNLQKQHKTMTTAEILQQMKKKQNKNSEETF